MKYSRILLPLLFLCMPFIMWSQERGIPIYSDYLTDNLYLLHPSMAGATTHNQIRLTGRTQWFNVDDAPNLVTLSANGRITDHIGIGGILFNDSNGRFSQQGVYATFAYHIQFAQSRWELNQLSFGLNVGVLQEKLDESDLIGPGQPIDPIINGHKQKDVFFNMDFGMSYFYRNFFIHATVKNLIPQKRDIFSENFETDDQRQYLLSVGYTIAPNNSRWLFEPSIMAQYKEETGETIGDINGKVYYKFDWGKLWGGASYRRSFQGAEYILGDGSAVQSQKLQYVTPFLGVTYKNFIFAYTYSYQTNEVVMDQSGYHQITLGYNFGSRNASYQCDCPTVN